MTTRRIACVAAGLALLFAACNSDSRQLLDQAEARWRSGSYEDAVRLNLLLYDRDPKGPYAARALLKLGDIYYLNLRQLNKAIEAYQKLVQELPDRPEKLKAREQLASIYLNEIGDPSQAVSEYDRILESQNLENRAEIQFQRATAYFRMNDFSRALRELRRLEEQGIQGHFADQVYFKIGNIYQIRNRFDDALEAFQKVAVSPCVECRRRAVLNVAETYEALYDFDNAIASFKRLDPTPENQDLIRQEIARIDNKRRRMNGVRSTHFASP